MYNQHKTNGLKSYVQKIQNKKNYLKNKDIYRNLANMAISQQEIIHVFKRDINWIAQINGIKTPIIESNIENFKNILIENFEQGKKIIFHKPYGQADKRISDREQIVEYIDSH